ncbi:hypothetical protein JTE90_007377, partial [Oedothorax gibbosus]
VVFSEEAKEKIKELSTNSSVGSTEKGAAVKLLTSIDLINEVPDRQAVTTISAERKCVNSQGSTRCIDAAVLQYAQSRSFVR